MYTRIAVIGTLALAAGTALLTAAAGSAGGVPGGSREELYEVPGHEAVRDMAEQGDILPLERILQQARQQHAGRVLETELESSHGDLVYEVEILDDNGEVWEMRFDARNGTLIGAEQGD